MSIVILTECTARKVIDNQCFTIPEIVHKLTELFNSSYPDFDYWNEEYYRKILESKGLLNRIVKPAECIYCGDHFVLIRSVKDLLRIQGFKVDMWIFSSRYGLIKSDEKIIPYEAYFYDPKFRYIESKWIQEKFVETFWNFYKALRTSQPDLLIIVCGQLYLDKLKEFIYKLYNIEIKEVLKEICRRYIVCSWTGKEKDIWRDRIIEIVKELSTRKLTIDELTKLLIEKGCREGV